ncbi:class I SAM-dependent RNA methyltransferase [Novosphingobium sp.]|uniref:class I SAM-dependent RNA methyltransferase n=1 Tax=Novosphingobium sp. TaxID=1874826 RepID=UPI0025F98B38|nr:class I SAM-dependent RNA methyltransferase [Novosphingobium sp.]
MIGASPVVRIAAKGDGVTEDGRHVALAAPGDMVAADGTVTPGVHHAAPACRHYPQCGGCQLQHLDEAALADFVADRVIGAVLGQHLELPQIVAPPHLSPPASRRRATLHAQAIGKRVVLGFREQGTHHIVDLRECAVTAPALVALVKPLRELLTRFATRGMAVDVEMTLADQGVSVGIKGLAVEGLAAIESLGDFARAHGLARLTMDAGYGPETQWEPEPVTMTVGGVPVALPAGAFLQATPDGEAALTSAACEWLDGAAMVADLFSGLGTFAFALVKAGPAGRKVLAVEADRAAHLAGQGVARMNGLQVHSLHRDLFRNPLRPEELNRFDAVVLDPPRAGAREQVALIADSTVARVVYVSCNPSSWARDAARLVEGGYRLAELRAVGQFRWSTHVELASLFVR